MNKKRIAALVAAGTMLLSATPVYADNTITATGRSIDVVTGGSTATSAGSIAGVDDTPIYEVILPTANALKFTVDPYGLTDLDLTTGSAVLLDDLKDGPGTIKTASGSGALIVNESSRDVAVNVKLYTDLTGGAALKGSKAEVSTGDAVEMFLALVPSSTKATSIASYSAANQAIAVTATGSADANTAQFLLGKADYKVIGNETQGYSIEKVDGTGDGTVLMVDGYANPRASWREYSKTASPAGTLILHAVFEYTSTVTGLEANVATGGAYKLVTGSSITSFEPAVTYTVTELTRPSTFGSKNTNYECYWDMSAYGYPTTAVDKFEISNDGTNFTELTHSATAASGKWHNNGSYIGFINDSSWSYQTVKVTMGTNVYVIHLDQR